MNELCCGCLCGALALGVGTPTSLHLGDVDDIPPVGTAEANGPKSLLFEVREKELELCICLRLFSTNVAVRSFGLGNCTGVRAEAGVKDGCVSKRWTVSCCFANLNKQRKHMEKVLIIFYGGTFSTFKERDPLRFYLQFFQYIKIKSKSVFSV